MRGYLHGSAVKDYKATAELLTREELHRVWILRKVLSPLPPVEAMELILDKLAKTIPPGVTLTNVRQQGMNLTLLGTSASNAMVSEYLQNLEAMDLFVQPDLQYVRVFQQAASRVERYEFSISVRLDTNRGAEDEASVEDLEGTG